MGGFKERKKTDSEGKGGLKMMGQINVERHFNLFLSLVGDVFSSGVGGGRMFDTAPLPAESIAPLVSFMYN